MNKIKINKDLLLSILKNVNKVINTKATLPVLDSCLISVKKKSISFTATDLEITITEAVGYKSEEEYDVILDSLLLERLCRKLPDEEIVIQITKEKGMINSFKGEYDIPIIHKTEDFPSFAKLKEAKSFDVESKKFLTMIGKAIFATADDELRPVMNGVFVDNKKDALTIVASDAHILTTLKSDKDLGEEFSFILPSKGCHVLSKYDVGETIKVEYDDKNVSMIFKSDHESKVKLDIRLTEGNYPNYETVIPKEYNIEVYVNRKDMISSLERLISYAEKGGSPLMKINLSDDSKLVLSYENVDNAKRFEETIESTKTVIDKVDLIDMGFSYVKLLAIFNEMDNEEIVMCLSDPAKAMICYNAKEGKIDHKDQLVLLMPMAIQ